MFALEHSSKVLPALAPGMLSMRVLRFASCYVFSASSVCLLDDFLTHPAIVRFSLRKRKRTPWSENARDR